MKQVLQNLRNGETSLTTVPVPGVSRKGVLVQTRRTLISAGTEKMLVEFGQASFIGKARAQPEKVKQVLDKIRTDGLLPTLETVFSKLNEPLPLGYCNAGVVAEVGADVHGLSVGDRVISNGAHAEFVSVPEMLCAKIPDGVTDEQAAFTVLASIGLQGVRLVAPTLGETVVVFGAGLIGLLTVQLLLANGCRVVAIDINEKRLALARAFGAETINGAASADPVTGVMSITGGQGADAVLITASTKSSDLMHQAAQMSRRRGRIVLVGVVGLELLRSDFYEKELTFQVSCSYGPGRYDDRYEQQGQDYPLGFVRWTEQRNFEAVLQMLATKRLDVDSLVTDRFPFDRAQEAYAKVQSDKSALGVVLEYSDAPERADTIEIATGPKKVVTGKPVVALIGAGSFARSVLGPGLAKCDARLKYVTARTNAAAAQHLATKCGFEIATTNLDQVLDDPEVDVVFIATRHDTHAPLTIRAMEAGKHVFCEKPMAINEEQLAEVVACCEKHPELHYMVGFNRRYSPHTKFVEKLLEGRREPLAMQYTINAGAIPKDTWYQDPATGGGRIIGEACHFIDLLAYFAKSPITTVKSVMMGEGVEVRDDKMCIILGFEDGSIGSVNYFANGAKSYPKERVEVYSEGRVIVIDNFKAARCFGASRSSRRTANLDKGHVRMIRELMTAISSEGPWLGTGQLENVTTVSLLAKQVDPLNGAE